ncbi:hypothetical protein [Chryseobacterium sp.]|uniref:hypothetical protein n=1 Tax=Chryseobacterium sp. TaxID=1871047 RepID=UPI00289654AA|nr:hypothetical protein [Chryseobacterium sp.]
MKKHLILFLLSISATLFSQKIKFSSEIIDTYFIRYPEDILPYKFIEYKSQIEVSKTKMVIKSEDEKISEISINENIFTKIRNDVKGNHLPIGNLQKTKASGSGILDEIVEIGTMNLNYHVNKNGRNSWENKYRILMTLEAPLKIIFKDSYNNETYKEDTVTIKYQNEEFASLIFNKDHLQTLLKTDFTSINEAKKAAANFLKTNSDNIPMSVFDALLSNNQIAVFWKFYNKKYSLNLEKTGTLFLDTFKDEKNITFLEYNKNINRIKDITKEINNTAFKENYISKEKVNEAKQISKYLENEINKNTNEDIITALQLALLPTYFITEDFEKAAQIVDRLNEKGKVNLKLNHYLSELKKLEQYKIKYQENKSNSSITYTETLDKILK